MKRFLDDLLARQPVPSRSNGYFPLNAQPASLLRCRDSRKTAEERRPAPAKRLAGRRRPLIRF
jgi:hypothetical protein